MFIVRRYRCGCEGMRVLVWVRGYEGIGVGARVLVEGISVGVRVLVWVRG